MVVRIEVMLKPEFEDSKARALMRRLITDYSLSNLTDVRCVQVYTFEKPLSEKDAHTVAKEVFTDAITQFYALDRPADQAFCAGIEISYRPGVKDNLADTAKIACQDALSKQIEANIFSSTLYLFYGEFALELADQICQSVLCNPLIEQYHILEPQNISFYYSNTNIPSVKTEQKGYVDSIPLPNSKKELEKISKRRLLALNVDEMMQIRNYYKRPKTIREREKMKMPQDPTDVELECIAQTWSEHCKHKIFNAQIDYTEYDIKNAKKEKVKQEKIDSLFKTYISKTTKSIKSAQAYLLSVFSDNAGILAIDDDWALAIKAETHNSPSALDPFGGALTGILGVNRDVLGAGLGAKPIFNTDVFCFANPNYDQKIPPKLHHPKRVYDGVRAGVEFGGNASGIPTINGSIVFDDRYLGKPLVYCGTGGLMPRKLKDGRKTHIKTIKPKDRIFMIGGKIGKDGIHGATFSSLELNETSPTSAVQLGDPFTQKILSDFLLESQERCLYSGLTDNGAGGLSSSIGELATLTNGAIIHLERAPLKYPGLNPWEIFVSESQERMTVAVPPKNAPEFLALAKTHGVEATDIGEFSDDGYLSVFYHSKPVLYLELKFMHDSLLKMKLKAVHMPKEFKINEPDVPSDMKSMILNMLSRLNICSKESVIRQYDHEVLGMSSIKPLCGVHNGPSDCAMQIPFYGKNTAIFVSHGICPKFSDYDTYDMAQLAVDEAVRNYIATGGDPTHWGALDNFCWPDPIESDKNLDGAFKLAQLVRANKGLADICLAYSLPLVSGKDSMKNDYSHGGIKISIPPTLLITLCGFSKDARWSATTDFKQSKDLIYVLGKTYDELSGSEYYAHTKSFGKTHPKVRMTDNFKLYKKVYLAIKKGLIRSCHDCSDGGIAVSLAESCIGANLGCTINTNKIPRDEGMTDDKILFSESAGRFIVSINMSSKKEFEELMSGCVFAQIGEVCDNQTFVINGSEDSIKISISTSELEESFKKTLSANYL